MAVIDLRHTVNLFLIFFIIITYPVNMKVFLFLRHVDILIFIGFGLNFYFNNLKRDFFSPIQVLLLCLLVFSGINGLIFVPDNSISQEGLGFLFKYIEIFLFFWLVYSISLSEKEIKRFLLLSMIVYILMILYILVRL